MYLIIRIENSKWIIRKEAKLNVGVCYNVEVIFLPKIIISRNRLIIIIIIRPIKKLN